MSEPIPIMCTLSPAELRDRGTAWRKLLDSGLVDRRRVLGGVRLAAQPGAAAALLELVELERACCPWITIDIAEGPQVTLTAESTDGEDVLAHVFLPGGG